MAENDLYSALIEIGLKDYLETRGGGSIIEEKWMVNLDSYVSNLTDEQKIKLKNKIEKKNNETHSQHNDVLHEISVACAFYDNVDFLEENNNEHTPDFHSGRISVEVKTINNSDIEKSRLCDLDKGPHCKMHKHDGNLIENFKILSIQSIANKFKDHIEKAKKQLGADGGHICIVYAVDSPPYFHDDEKLKAEIENKFDEIIREDSIKYEMRYINFGKLRDKIENKIC